MSSFVYNNCSLHFMSYVELCLETECDLTYFIILVWLHDSNSKLCVTLTILFIEEEIIIFDYVVLNFLFLLAL